MHAVIGPSSHRVPFSVSLILIAIITVVGGGLLGPSTQSAVARSSAPEVVLSNSSRSAKVPLAAGLSTPASYVNAARPCAFQPCIRAVKREGDKLFYGFMYEGLGLGGNKPDFFQIGYREFPDGPHAQLPDLRVSAIQYPAAPYAHYGELGLDPTKSWYVYANACKDGGFLQRSWCTDWGSSDWGSSALYHDLPDGYDTCQQGFVWREAQPGGDHVCVVPETRQQAADDNALANQRRSRFLHRDPTTGILYRGGCIGGFVEREAFTDDHVCVTPQVRDQARIDNSEREKRYKRNLGR